MTDLPKHWLFRGRSFRLICLASEARTDKPLYVMEETDTGMNTAIPFDDPDLEVDDFGIKKFDPPVPACVGLESVTWDEVKALKKICTTSRYVGKHSRGTYWAAFFEAHEEYEKLMKEKTDGK